MYKLSCEKCVVCFLFLVMVAFLSCSGFRIDNAMSASQDMDIVGARTASLSGLTSDSASRTRRTHKWRARHRIRHSKHSSPADARVTETPSLPPAIAQVPQPPSPTSSIDVYVRMPSRSQRALQLRPAPATTGGGKKRRPKPCQEQDVARKAYLANTVVLAKADSMSLNRVRNYSVSFRIIKRFKTPEYATADDILRLTFLNNTKRVNCESEMYGGEGGIVKAQIAQSKEYYLFLNSQGSHNYTIVGTPVLNRPKQHSRIERILLDVTRKNFVPRLRKPELVKHINPEERDKKVRLICRVKGNPIPVIEWKKNETLLHSNSNLRITYRGRRSTLVIKNAEEKDSGRYTCVARGVNGHESESSLELRISNKEKCENDLFCLNGICNFNTDLKEAYCICSDGYQGTRCDQKTLDRMPPQTSKSDLSTCEKHGVPRHMCQLS